MQTTSVPPTLFQTLLQCHLVSRHYFSVVALTCVRGLGEESVLYLPTALDGELSEMGVGILFITGPGTLPALGNRSGKCLPS